MSLPFSRWGSFSRSAGIYSILGKHAKLINYGGVKKVTFSFDPFTDGEAVFHTRSALVYMNGQSQRATNPKCIVKTSVLGDRCPPTILVQLLDGSEVLFKTEYLTTLEILEHFNSLVSSKAPQKQDTTGHVVQTKAEKAAAAGQQNKRKK